MRQKAGVMKTRQFAQWNRLQRRESWNKSCEAAVQSSSMAEGSWDS